MIPKPAQYLLRFDDLCPTVDRTRWESFRSLIEEFEIQPILAVVPDNWDKKLARSQADPAFWAQMQAMEAAGAAIGLHGYRHLCRSRGRGLLPLHSRTEFAGVPEWMQRQWIHDGLETLRAQGLSPQLWVAPRHGFDRATLRALKAEGIGLLSDGLARTPFTRCGFTWIPQQLWQPVEKPGGLWTICIHCNTARGSTVDGLRAFLRQHREQFTSVDRILAEFPPAKLDLKEDIYSRWTLWRMQISRAKSLWLSKRRKPSGSRARRGSGR
jgi:predicted deacetylase